MRRHLVGLLVLGALGALPLAARADLVHLPGGQTLSVKSYRIDGDQAVLTLRAGGEITCPASLIERVTPDEVPYPEPVAEVTPPAAVPSAGLPANDEARYRELIEPLAARHGVDARLVRAVVEIESNYRSDARSRKGAMGLMQLMPATARPYAVQNPYDPLSNLDAGIRHLRTLLDRFDVRLALAAYNAGEATVRRYNGIPPFPETRSYVTRVLQRAGR
jgi:hypothetical protein